MFSPKHLVENNVLNELTSAVQLRWQEALLCRMHSRSLHWLEDGSWTWQPVCSWLLIKVVAVARCCVKCVSVVLMEQRHGCVSERLVKKKNKQVCFQSGYYSKSWALLFYVLTKTAAKCWVKSPLVNQMNFPKFFSYSRRSYFITKELLFFFFFSTFLETVEFLEAKCCGYFLSSCIPVRSAI